MNLRDSITFRERSLNFSKEEKARFKNLIDKYQAVLFNKKTDNCNNVQKKKAWNAIHAEFNALSENPRTLKQLQAKFDNMKRNARKDASKQRQERFKTGGGPPPPPADADTDWLRSVMPVSMDGLASTIDDDSQIGVQKTEDIPEVSILNKEIKRKGKERKRKIASYVSVEFRLRRYRCRPWRCLAIRQ
ncbi:myb/SANT-like DNA-binding domain-containing protein 3 [Maniola hyperantus]|uniref:myb/SANT-like DNA-binding domain-containing protein 3 n=1 Tax=Aphantopus hyperantus TaxID=2795564 RepID=UPI00212B3765